MHLWSIVLAAGSSTRLRASGITTAKQFLLWQGSPLYWHSALVLSRHPWMRGIVFVFPPDPEQGGIDTACLKQLQELSTRAATPFEYLAAAGGARRQDSVRNGLAMLPASCTHVLVHDAARPWIDGPLIARVAQGLAQGNAGVIPVVPVADTIKAVDAAECVVRTYVRDTLRAVQTPQGFCVRTLRQAHIQAEKQGWDVTDDAGLLEWLGVAVQCVPGSVENNKITQYEDLAMLEEKDRGRRFPCTGFGYDVHRFGGERALLLGGVPIAGGITVEAHSDGDVVLHALIDALLGCLCLGDIGTLFPDSDPAYAGISSGVLLAEVVELAARKDLRLEHVDMTVVAQIPRLAPHREAIAKNIAKMLRLPVTRVNVKATTEEKLGFTGEKKGLKAIAVVSGSRPVA